MGNYQLLEKFDDEYEGISYNGEIFYHVDDRSSFCKIYVGIGEMHHVIQRDTYKSAVSEVEGRIRKYLEESKIEKSSKRFFICPIA